MELAAAPTDVILSLRGQRDLRPRIDPGLAGGLRSWLEDDLAECASHLDPNEPLFLSPRAMTHEALSSVPPLSALARGALVSALCTQRLSLGEVNHPMDDALSALEADPAHAELVDTVHGLDPDEFARLSSEVAAHDSVLARHLSRVPSSWLPRSNVRLSVPLVGGRVVLGTVVNVVLGAPSVNVASICLLHVTTSSLEETTAAMLSVVALIETLRSGAQPLRVASLSTATGEVAICDVNDHVLTQGVELVVRAVRARGAGQ